MTSLAVRLETSSTSQKEGRVRERKEERNRGGWGEKNKKKEIIQAGSEGICSFKKNVSKKGESDAKKKKPCICVCTESIPNYSSVTCL